VRKVQRGEIDVGFHHTANLIIANSEGADLRVVMSYLVQELCAAFSAAEDGNVTTPKKMEGLIWGGPKTCVCTDILPAVLLAGGVDVTKVKMRLVEQAERFPMLAANTIQATDSYLDKAYYIRQELALRENVLKLGDGDPRDDGKASRDDREGHRSSDYGIELHRQESPRGSPHNR
jgi:hypothetical protein